MSTQKPPYLMWIKDKIRSTRAADVVNLATSGVVTEFANRWQADALVNRGNDILQRAQQSHEYGLPELKSAIRAACQLPTEREIVLTCGASGGIRLVCEVLLAGRSDAEVIVETPSYEPLRAIPQRLGAKVIRVDRRELPACGRLVTAKTVAVILSNPNNPSGHWLSYDELRQVARELDGAGSHALIVVDEVYCDAGPEPATTAAAVDPRIVTISSLSKSHGLAALRCGWVTADPRFMQNLLHDWVLFQNAGFQTAEVLGAMAFERIAEFREAARRQLARNRALAEGRLNQMAAAHLIEPMEIPPGCVLFARLPDCGSTATLVDRLAADFGVLVTPGVFFGDAYDDCIRIGICGDHERLQLGLSRLADGLAHQRLEPA